MVRPVYRDGDHYAFLIGDAGHFTDDIGTETSSLFVNAPMPQFQVASAMPYPSSQILKGKVVVTF
jgi:hypothetical protein